MSSQVVAPLEAGRQAASRHAWREAYDAFTSANAEALTPEDLESFAEAAWWSGKLDEAIELRERSYAGFAAGGEKRSAIRVALAVAWDHALRGAFSLARGWLANVERLLQEQPESPEHGHAAMVRGSITLLTGGNLDEALSEVDRAHDIAKRFGDRDLEAMAVADKGRVLIHSGQVEEGLALLDEATAAATCGELRPFWTGAVYCSTISSCQDVGDFRRAAEWAEAANRWCERVDVTGFPGSCRVHHAEIMRLRGDWTKAEEQALAACAELQDFDRMITAGGYYEVGEVRRRRGEFAAAEEAYREANAWGHDPQPGLALLRLVQGKVQEAVANVRRALEEVEAPLMRLRALPAQVEIAVADGDLKTARAAADELERVVDAHKIGDRRTPAFDAAVHLAFGRIKLAEGDSEWATRCLRRARDGWREVGAPYEIAQARMLLGLAYRRQGDEPAVRSELEAALMTFERLGAKLDEERVKELLGRLETRRTFLFSDIVDSTKLLETLGDAKWKKLLARHNELTREAIERAGGEVIKSTGDGFFAAFEGPKAAVEAAVAVQRALDGEVYAPDVRIGVHTGGAFHTGGDVADYGGQGVHAAARIASAAGAGEILVSDETLDGAQTAFALSEPRGEELKGFEESVEVVSVDWR
jgi:class 3 adenylate cyclase